MGGGQRVNIEAVPDLVGMLLMMGVLVWLRRRHSDERVDLWLCGLLFILVEVVAAHIYRFSAAGNLAAHVIALDAYLFAGATFGWAARQDDLRGRTQFAFFGLPILPMAILCTLYGLGTARTLSYVVVAAISLVVGLLVLLLSGKASRPVRWALGAAHLVVWVPTLLLALAGQTRWLAYWGLTCLYLLVAFSFRRRVRRGNIGGIIIIAGFTIWAFCFLLHPLVHDRLVYDVLVEQIWTMQKFVVILGMLLTLLEDETERRKAEAMHDPMTGLPNRRLFDDRLSQALERSLRTGRSTALFLVDLDNFKAINDTYGHAAGDLALRAAAAQLQLKVRSSDTLARCGGDEFCIIVNELTRRDDCERIAHALRDAVAHVSPTEWGLAASIGYALFPDDVRDATALFNLADRRMYQQKHNDQSAIASADETPEIRMPVLLKRHAR